MGGGLLDVRGHPQRRRGALAAEADVGEEGALGQVHADEHVAERRPRRIKRQHPADPRRQRRHRETQRPQHAEKNAVLLEAIAAARAVHEFALERGRIDQHRPPE